MATKQNVKNSVSGGSGKVIGGLVFWKDLSDVRVNRQTWKMAVEQVGLKAALSKDPSPERVLSGAVTVANRRAPEQAGTRNKLGYAKLKAKGDEAVYSVLMRRDQGDRMGYLEEATIALDRGAESPIPATAVEPSAPADDDRDAIIATILTEYTDALTYAFTCEVSETLVRAVRDVCSGLSLRSGVYVVHPDHIATLDAFAEYLSTIGVTFEVWTVRDDGSRNAKQASREASGSLRAAYDEMMAEVAAFRAENPPGDDVSGKSIATRVRRFKDLDAKVDLYADVVGEYAAQLRAQIAAAKADLEAAYLDGGLDKSAA